MISILASPKPWHGLAAVHQYNAVKSWLALHPGVEVILYGAAPGTAEACERLGVQHVPHVDATPEGVPYFGAIADHAAEHARCDLQCYVNCDILFTKSLLDATQRVFFKQFLMIGQRIDLAEGVAIDVTNPDFLVEIRNLAEKGMAQLHPPAGSDYFVFPRGLWKGLPPVVIGRGGYDNVLIAFCLKKMIPAIDATPLVLAIHQHHDYSHVAEGASHIFGGDDARTNYSNISNMNGVSIEDVAWLMNGKGIYETKCRGDWARYLVLKSIIYSNSRFLQHLAVITRSLAYKLHLSKPKRYNLFEIIRLFENPKCDNQNI